MSKITVDAEHTEELQAALTAAEGRAYTRTISAKELIAYAAEADRRLAPFHPRESPVGILCGHCGRHRVEG